MTLSQRMATAALLASIALAGCGRVFTAEDAAACVEAHLVLERSRYRFSVWVHGPREERPAKVEQSVAEVRARWEEREPPIAVNGTDFVVALPKKTSRGAWGLIECHVAPDESIRHGPAARWRYDTGATWEPNENGIFIRTDR